MDMKTILFICRSELSDLFAELGKRLQHAFRVEYVAYNGDDVVRLAAHGVKPDAVFTEMLAKQPMRTPSPEQLKELDSFILRWSDGRFSVNSAIQSDRTYAGMTYAEALGNLFRCHCVWREYFSARKIAYAFHEPVSLAFNQMAELNCKANGGRYLTFITALGQHKYNYLILDAGNAACPELLKHLERSDESETSDQPDIAAYLEKFRHDFQILAANVMPKTSALKLLTRGIAHEVKRFFTRDRVPRQADSVSYFLRRVNPWMSRFRNRRDYKRKLRYDEPAANDKYYYYSFHLEPEAVVLYWGDGVYTNQVKLIENIAGQLPPGYFLYVKDHPHLLYYRSVEDYLRIKKIPNVKLMAPHIPGKQLISNARGVFSINATAGLEALLMQKEVYIVGNAFYAACPLVHSLRNIRDLRDALYAETPWNEEKERILHRFLAALFKSTHEGVVCFFSGMAQKFPIDHNRNFDNIAADLQNFDRLLSPPEKDEE